MEKPHLVLLHAALGNSGQMAGVAAQLETRFCVHNFQFPGHDGVDPDAHICLNALVQSVEAYLMHQKLERPTVLGNSLGGYVAALLEARKPGSIGSLITFATKWFWDEATSGRNNPNWFRPQFWKSYPLLQPSFSKCLGQIGRKLCGPPGVCLMKSSGIRFHTDRFLFRFGFFGAIRTNGLQRQNPFRRPNPLPWENTRRSSEQVMAFIRFREKFGTGWPSRFLGNRLHYKPVLSFPHPGNFERML